ncbi:MAG: YdbL family protein [Oceanicoccus sp.]
MKLILGFLFATVLCVNSAYALSLQDAKSQGLVGERTDGYVGYVAAPPTDEVKSIVKMVNRKRREKFQETAKNNSISIDQVGILFYQRAVEKTKPDQYYQDAEGDWTKK